MKFEETHNKAPRLEKPVRITDQVWPEGTAPVVSICCITYQHVNFIRDAVEGFLMQETTFPVEIIIRDDASSDGTAEIVREYQEKFPQLIRTILHSANQYSQGKKSLPETYAIAQGEFIAICEGDDYWICEEKLQKQVSILESCQDYSMVFHGAYIKHIDGSIIAQNVLKSGECLIGIGDLLRFNPVATHSAVIRSAIFRNIPNKFQACAMGDRPLWLTAAMHGKIAFDPNVRGVYRKHAGGVWSSLGCIRGLPLDLQFYSIASYIIPESYRKESIEGIAIAFAELMWRVFTSHDSGGAYAKARRYVRESKWHAADVWRAIGIQLIKLDFLGKVGSKNINIKEMRTLLYDMKQASRELSVDGKWMRRAAAESVSSQAMTLARKASLTSLLLFILALSVSPSAVARNLRVQLCKSRLDRKS